jgi:hypothetical protein
VSIDQLSPSGTEVVDVRNPATGELVGSVPELYERRWQLYCRDTWFHTRWVRVMGTAGMLGSTLTWLGVWGM